MTAWTIESGAKRERGDVEDPRAERDEHAEREPLRPGTGQTALATGCFRLTSGAAHAPRCFSRKPTFVANAQKMARRIPIESKVI